MQACFKRGQIRAIRVATGASAPQELRRLRLAGVGADQALADEAGELGQIDERVARIHVGVAGQRSDDVVAEQTAAVSLRGLGRLVHAVGREDPQSFVVCLADRLREQPGKLVDDHAQVRRRRQVAGVENQDFVTVAGLLHYLEKLGNLDAILARRSEVAAQQVSGAVDRDSVGGNVHHERTGGVQIVTQCHHGGVRLAMGERFRARLRRVPGLPIALTKGDRRHFLQRTNVVFDREVGGGGRRWAGPDQPHQQGHQRDDRKR